MGDAVQRLLHRLDLERGPAGERDQMWLGEAGENALNRSNSLFGGMVFAQTIVAAGRTHPDRHVHSVQQVFLRGGRADLPLRYRVERLFDGRTYASVRVEVRQGEHVISHAQVGVTVGIESPDRQEPSPATTTLDATVNRDEFRGHDDWHDQPVEVRFDPNRHEDGIPTLDTWIRPDGPLPADPLLHQAVLGYVSDRAFMSVAWKPHQAHADFRGATLDHSIWFHRPVDFDRWHVYAMHSPTIADGRGLVHGTIHDEHGTHVASTVQQGTFRPVRPTSPPA